MVAGDSMNTETVTTSSPMEMQRMASAGDALITMEFPERTDISHGANPKDLGEPRTNSANRSLQRRNNQNQELDRSHYRGGKSWRNRSEAITRGTLRNNIGPRAFSTAPPRKSITSSPNYETMNSRAMFC